MVLLDDLASPTFIRERVIVADTRKNLNAIVTANLAFASAENSGTDYLMAKNKELAKKLQVVRQEVEQLQEAAQNTAFTQVYVEELKAAILGKVSTLEETMQNLYEELIIMHKEVVHLHGLQ